MTTQLSGNTIDVHMNNSVKITNLGAIVSFKHYGLQVLGFETPTIKKFQGGSGVLQKYQELTLYQ